LFSFLSLHISLSCLTGLLEEERVAFFTIIMASLFKNALEQVGQLHKADDDITDRLNRRFTVILLVTFTAFVSAKQFIG